MRDGFILHEKTMTQVALLDDAQAGELLKAMIAHYKGEEMDTSQIVSIVMVDAKERMDADTEAYERVSASRSEAGRAGAEARWGCQNDGNDMANDGKAMANDSKRIANDSKQMAKDGVSVSVSVPVSVDTKENSPTESKRKAFVPPTVEEVRAYCIERQNTVDAEQFVDFYASKGWKVGSQAMKDWKACVRTWEKRETQKPAAPPGRKANKFVNFDRNRDNDALMAQIIGRAEGRIV